MTIDWFLNNILNAVREHDYLVTEQLYLEPDTERLYNENSYFHCRRVTFLGLKARIPKIVKKFQETGWLPSVAFAVYDGAFGSRINTMFFEYKSRLLKALNDAGVDEKKAEREIYAATSIYANTVCGDPSCSMLHHFVTKIHDLKVYDWCKNHNEYLERIITNKLEQPGYRLGGNINPNIRQATLSISVANVGAIPFATVNFIDGKAYVNVWLRTIKSVNIDAFISAFEQSEQFKLDIFESRVDKLNFITEYLKYSISETIINMAMPNATIEGHDFVLKRTMFKTEFDIVNQKSHVEISEFLKSVIIYLNPIRPLAPEPLNSYEVLLNVWADKFCADYHATFGGLTQNMIDNGSSIYPIETFITYDDVSGLNELTTRLEWLGRLQAVGAIDVEWGTNSDGDYTQMAKVNTRAIIEIVDRYREWLPVLCECQNQDLYDKWEEFYTYALHKYHNARPDEISYTICHELCTIGSGLRRAAFFPNDIAKAFGFDKTMKENEHVKNFRLWYFSH